MVWVGVFVMVIDWAIVNVFDPVRACVHVNVMVASREGECV